MTRQCHSIYFSSFFYFSVSSLFLFFLFRPFFRLFYFFSLKHFFFFAKTQDSEKCKFSDTARSINARSQRATIHGVALSQFSTAERFSGHVVVTRVKKCWHWEARARANVPIGYHQKVLNSHQLNVRNHRGKLARTCPGSSQLMRLQLPDLNPSMN